MKTNVIYDKMTNRVILMNIGDDWIIPGYLDLATFDNGVEPVFIDDGNGNIYLKPNAIIVKGDN